MLHEKIAATTETKQKRKLTEQQNEGERKMLQIPKTHKTLKQLREKCCKFIPQNGSTPGL